MVEAIIFDRDGVLVGFDMDVAAALFPASFPLGLDELDRRWLAHGQAHGFPRSVDEEKQFMRSMWDTISDQYALSSAMRRQLYDVDYTRVLYRFPDARPALKYARSKGLKVAVLTNFALASVEASLVAVGLDDLVDVAAAATVIGAAKPDPAAYGHVTTRLGVAPEACLFFDDEAGHIAGARALGMSAYLVDRTRDQHDLAHGIVCDLSALDSLLSQP